MANQVAIIGAGLAGSEAAWQLATRGIATTLFEMRPTRMTEAHRTGNPAELVCSNSFKSIDNTNAHGLLKAELKLAGSLIIQTAEEMAVPAGSALAVDRDRFAESIKNRLDAEKNISYQVAEVTEIAPLLDEYQYVIIAAGPLCSDNLSQSMLALINDSDLCFYDAISPVIYKDSIDMAVAFKASRYGKGDSDYINCPLDESEYLRFVGEIRNAKKVPFKSYEKSKHFEGCLPIEIMAERGLETLAFGPLKPVGLIDPRTGQQPHAVLQLRQENLEDTLYNLVGCQTRMTWDEQKRVFRTIPGLGACEFARMGSMHRNTYINAPKHLTASLNLKTYHRIFLAGQITGVEGYSESTAMGVWAAMNIIADIDETRLAPKVDTRYMIGGLVNYLLSASSDAFQPMNANFGLIKSLSGKKIKNKKEKRQRMAEIALESWKEELQRISWV